MHTEHGVLKLLRIFEVVDHYANTSFGAVDRTAMGLVSVRVGEEVGYRASTCGADRIDKILEHLGT